MRARKERPKCLNCFKPTNHLKRKCCSYKCAWENKYNIFIVLWLEDKIPFEILSNVNGSPVNFIRKYLIKKYENKCAKCGWNTPHPADGIPPLEIDHIDGNWHNNKEVNLILLCPNCHSLTLTYKNRKRDNGNTPARLRTNKRGR